MVCCSVIPALRSKLHLFINICSLHGRFHHFEESLELASIWVLVLPNTLILSFQNQWCFQNKWLLQGFLYFVPGDPNVSIKIFRDPKQTKTVNLLKLLRGWACRASQSFPKVVVILDTRTPGPHLYDFTLFTATCFMNFEGFNKISNSKTFD